MIHIYTDGSSLGNPGPGGRGVIIWSDGKRIYHAAGGEPRTTNNRMELTAALHALERCAGKHGEAGSNFMDACGDYTQVTLHTDSTYVHDGLTKFLDRRMAKGWKLANRKPVLNKDLRSQLATYKNIGEEISRKRVKAHATSTHNNMVDKLARAAALKQQESIPDGFVPGEIGGRGDEGDVKQVGLW